MEEMTVLSVIILEGDEPNVIKLTYENLYKEIKSIPDAELIVAKDWFDAVSVIHNKLVCFVESDCLVNSGYFASQLSLFNKNSHMRKLAMLSSAVGVNNWANRIYGYKLGENYADGVIPVKEKVSSSVHPIQMGFLPGAIVRPSMLMKAIRTLDIKDHTKMDLVSLSCALSLEFWKQGDGNRVHINQNTTYVTTEDYVADMGTPVPVDVKHLPQMFKQESI